MAKKKNKKNPETAAEVAPDTSASATPVKGVRLRLPAISRHSASNETRLNVPLGVGKNAKTLKFRQKNRLGDKHDPELETTHIVEDPVLVERLMTMHGLEEVR